MLKIVPIIDFCGGAEDEPQFKRYYEIQNTEHYEYHPDFTDLVEAINYVYDQGQKQVIIDLEDYGKLPYTDPLDERNLELDL